MRTAIKILLDTDIGDDIDDAVCLSMALGSPEFELLGVTTVYGDSLTRARIARKLCRAWGRPDLPVVPGFERPLRFDWYPGTVPEDPCSQRPSVSEEREPLEREPAAPAFIAEAIRRHPGEVFVLTIGAMTNLAAALSLDPGLAALIPGVLSNAGSLPPEHESHPEWNVRYDPLAARVVASSGVPWTVLAPAVAASNLGLNRAELDALAGRGLPATAALAELIVLYRRYKGRGDPAVRTIADVKRAWVSDTNVLFQLLFPGLVELRAGRIEVSDAALLCLRPAPDGPHRLAYSAFPAHLNAELMTRILGERLDGRTWND